MEYNKNVLCKANDKKVLHKIRKHWVVVSTALLMALGGGAVATTHASAHADANSNNGNAGTSSTQTATETPKATLTNADGSQSNNNAQQNPNNAQKVAMPSAQSNGQQASSNNKGLNPNVEKQAAALHSALMGGAAQSNEGSAQGFKANQTVFNQRPKMMLGVSPATYDQQGLYGAGNGFTWDPATKTASSDDNMDLDSRNDSYDDYGRVVINYVDVKPGDGNQWVGTKEQLTGISSDNPYNAVSDGGTGHADPFTQSDLKHYLTSIPQMQGPYGTGYKLVDSNNIMSDSNFDSGKGITSFVGGKDQQLTIRVVPNGEPATPAQIDVEYINQNDPNQVLKNHVYTYKNNGSFDQQGFINDPLSGWKVDHWNTETYNISTGENTTSSDQPASSTKNAITTFNDGERQTLHIYLTPNTSNDKAMIQYVNASDGSDVGDPRTVYGENGNAVNSDNKATGYLPSGYTFDNGANGKIGSIPDNFTSGIAGATTYQPNGNGLMYVAVNKSKTGTTVIPANVQMGTVTIHYQLSDGHGGGKGSDIETLPAVEPDHTQFKLSDFTNNVPDGYTYSQKSKQDGFPEGSNVVYYLNGQSQDVYIYLNANYKKPSQVTNARIQYKAIDPSNPNAPATTIGTSSDNFDTLPLYGQPGTPINYNQYKNNPPQGYSYVRMGTHADKLESNEDNIILVESTTTPNTAANEGTIEVDYIDNDQGSAKFGHIVYSRDFQGQNGTSFANDWSSAEGFMPAGYDTTENQNDSNAQNFVAGQTLHATVYVSNSNDQSNGGNSSDNNASDTSKTRYTDTIYYNVVDPMHVDPDGRLHVINTIESSKHPMGPMGTPINYSWYIQNVPSGYTFYKFGSPFSKQIGSGNDASSYIDILPNNYMPSPITINYVNQDGQIVNSDSQPDNTAEGEGMPIDEEPLTGDYGTTFTMSDINNDGNGGGLRPVPTGYTMNDGQTNMSVTVSNHAQVVDIMVHGNPGQHQTLHINRVVQDQSGHELFSDNIPVSVTGSNGDIRHYSAQGYTPNPSSYYSVVPGKSAGGNNGYNVMLSNGKLLQGDNGDDSLGTPIDGGKDDITFTYTENTATAMVTYVDPSDGNIVGTTSVTDKPGLSMGNASTGVYASHGLTKFVPSGYVLDTTAADSNNGISTDNKPTLLQGANYVIYVSNAYTQSNTITARPGYGYVTVNYQTKDKNGHWDTVAMETASGQNSDPFTGSNYTVSTSQGGYMPDAYKLDGTGLTTSDSSVTKFEKNTPQVYNVHVLNATKDDNANLGQQVTDMINYVAVNSDGTRDTSVPNPVDTVSTEGYDGTPIDYDQFTQIVPQGYNYAGLQSDIADYASGHNTSTNPIATILVKKASPYTKNVTPGYNPQNTNPVSDGKGGKVPNSGNKTQNSDGTVTNGAYFPWTFPNNSSDAPLDGPYNPFDPINGHTYNSDDPTVPNNYQHDSDGVLPKGYLPAWVPDKPADKAKASDYTAGYVPSDIIPDGYVPGFVPNGKGGYVPGYVPKDPSLQPGANANNPKNGGKTITHYVVVKVPDGKGGSTTGYGPDDAPYAQNTSANLTVEYVTGQNNSDKLQDVTVNGAVGSSLNFTDPSKSTYLYDLPSGYMFGKVLGQMTSSNVNSDVTSDVDNKYPDITSKNVYEFTATPHTIQIHLDQKAMATVIYEDASTHAQVGSAMVSGLAGSSLNFGQGGAQHKYEQLLPYNYNDPTMDDDTPVMSNGASYVIYVTKGNENNVPSPSKVSGEGQIHIVYQAPDNTTVGSDTLTGQYNKTIADLYPNEAQLFTKTSANGGYIPYGYTSATNADSVVNAINNDNFGKTPQTITVDVNNDNNEQNHPHNVADQIEYVEVTYKNGQTQKHVITTGSDGHGHSIPVPSDDPTSNHTPLSFTISGNEGSTIDYDPYETNVPSGFFFDGLGDHSSEFDNQHIGTNGKYEQIYVGQATQKPSQEKEAKIIVHYETQTGTDPSGNPIYTGVGSDITVNGNIGAAFNENYYEDNAPLYNNKQYVFDTHVAHTPIMAFTEDGNGNTTHTDDFVVVPKSDNTNQYGTITVEYKDMSNGQMLPTSNNIVTSGLAGSMFDPTQYQDQTPTGYDEGIIVSGAVIDGFKGGQNQTVVIGVSPDDN